MAQNKIVVTTTPPLPGTTLVSEVNAALQSLATGFAGNVDPASVGGVEPYFLWVDTLNGLIKRRNAANTAWVIEGRLFRSTLPIYPPSEIPTSDIGPIYIAGSGTAEWSNGQYLVTGVPYRGIIMWAGAIVDIPAGWALCDGNNGTPNLTDRFVIAAGGSYAVDATGDGSIPSHSHGAGTLSANSDGSHTHSGYTSSDGAHTHSPGGGGSYRVGEGTDQYVALQNTAGGSAGAHSHTVSINSGGAHTHTISGSTADAGTGSKVIATFYALAYIMKL